MPDPISRLQMAQTEIDKTFGSNYAREHPEVVSAVMIAATVNRFTSGTQIRQFLPSV